MYTLRSIARRGTMFVGAGALLFASFASGSSAFADALNPLTHRSLTLSSSAPGWNYTDGSGNSTSSQPTPSPYAVPNSGANGQKTGNTFSFNVSTNSSATGNDAKNAALEAFTFQYCTKSAGDCYSPGNNTFSSANGGTRGDDSAANRTSDLNVVTATPSEFSGTFGTYFDSDPTHETVKKVVPADNTAGNFIVLWNNGGTWQQSSGWSMASTNVESGAGTISSGERTGKNNFITLSNSSSSLKPKAGDAIKIIFFGTNTNYITNPGQGAFFVKINDYNDTAISDSTLVDGGVTVANVMNQSIQITTKVLETMDFSVGTVDPYTLSSADGTTGQSSLQKAKGVAYDSAHPNVTKHGTCDRILTGIDASQVASQNVLQLGDTGAEDSLSTEHTYSTHSYWRLSSNSSAGATVYYSGVTLSNTVGDQIDPINAGNGSAAAPQLGTEQFGLALANGTIAANTPLATFNPNANTGNVFPVDYGVERATLMNYENGADNNNQTIDASTTSDVGSNLSYHAPRLWPLVPAASYDSGAGYVNTDYATAKGGSVNTLFAFDTNSNLIPTPIASESNQVVDCVTGKMRYIANIAATTPAGIYTTKINYIAAPQY